MPVPYVYTQSLPITSKNNEPKLKLLPKIIFKSKALPPLSVKLWFQFTVLEAGNSNITLISIFRLRTTELKPQLDWQLRKSLRTYYAHIDYMRVRIEAFYSDFSTQNVYCCRDLLYIVIFSSLIVYPYTHIHKSLFGHQ